MPEQKKTEPKETKEKEVKEEKPLKKEHWFKIDGQPNSEEAYCQWMSDQVTKHPVVKVHHGIWKELIEWCDNNKQFSLWDSTTRKLQDVELNLRKKKVIINLMKPLVETIDGKLDLFHKIAVYPNSSEQKDIKGAQVSTSFIGYNDDVADHEEVMEEIKYDLLRTGFACKRWYWDPNSSGRVKVGKGTPKEDGEVMGKCVNIFNIRVGPTSAVKAKDVRWVQEIIESTRDQILRAYKDIKPADLLELREHEQHKEEGRFVFPEERKDNLETYIVKELRELPSQDYPQGRFIVTCANKCLHAGENKNPESQLGYYLYFWTKSNYSLYPKGPLHYVQPIQREFNRMISMISEHLESWRAKMAVGKGGLTNAQSMTVQAFEIVEVDYSRGEPKAMTMPKLDSDVAVYRDFLISSVDRVSNVHEVSYSRLPQYASRAPASLYSQMLEQENIKLASFIKRSNKTLKKEAQFRLQLMDKHYTVPRMTKIVGEGRQVSVEYWESADMNSNFDVRMEVGISVNQSMAIQQKVYMEMWQNGMFQETDRRKLVRVMTSGDAESPMAADIADEDRASRENQAALNGKWDDLEKYMNFINGKALNEIPELQNVPREQLLSVVYKHDDHIVHLESHTTFSKSAEYKSLPDEMKDTFQRHVEEHYMWYQSVMQAQAGAGQPMPGAGSQPAEPGAPQSPGNTPGTATGGGSPITEPGAGL